MRIDGSRKKKLIVAFHFHLANQAAWKCDDCRTKGLDQQRRCGFGKYAGGEGKRPVWVRRRAVAMECPKSFITGQSTAWLDEFFVWKASGTVDLMDLPARTAEALLTLEREWRLELEHAEQ